MFACYLRKYKGKMIPLCECVLLDTECEAKWYCVQHTNHMYREVNI